MWLKLLSDLLYKLICLDYFEWNMYRGVQYKVWDLLLFSELNKHKWHADCILFIEFGEVWHCDRSGDHGSREWTGSHSSLSGQWQSTRYWWNENNRLLSSQGITQGSLSEPTGEFCSEGQSSRSVTWPVCWCVLARELDYQISSSFFCYFVGVVVNVNSESERIIVSLNERALSEEQEANVKLVWKHIL